MKKLIIFNICLLFIFLNLVPFHATATYDTKIDFESDSLLLVSMDDGSVIIEKNSEKRRSPAGLAGIALAITAIENCRDLNEYATVKSSVLQEIANTGTQGIGLKPEEQIKVIDLLYAVMLSSASDAAIVLANHIADSTEDFLKLMNKTAKDAALLNTNFSNVIGIDDDNQYSTAKDIAKLSLYALKNETFEKISTSVSHKIAETNLSKERNLYTTNLMMLIGYTSYYNPLARGIRTGATSKAGRCVVTTATKDGYSYLALVMGAPLSGDKNLAFVECNKMLKWTFDHIRLRTLAEPYQTVAEVKVNLSSSADYVRLVPEKEIARLAPAGISSDDVLIQVIEDKTKLEINAPVKKGDILGEAEILYAGKEIARVNLVAAENINRSNSKYIGRLVKSFLTSPIFLAIAGIIIVFALFYVIKGLLKDAKRRKRIKLAKDKRLEAARRLKEKSKTKSKTKPKKLEPKDKDEPPKSILR